MRKIAFLLLVFMGLWSQSILAQTPGNFNYQAVVRDGNGKLIVDQTIDIRITIIDNTAPVYKEKHTVTTNSNGLVNLQIGSGSIDDGVFSDINWRENPKYMKIEIDLGPGYINMGTFQLLSVPYALYANSAETLGSGRVYSTQLDTLFVVKDHDGNVVFAVFPDGVQVYVSSATKGKLGGFAVSGRGATKGDLNYLMVTPDSTRIYVEDSEKGKLGGFAVSGRGATKGSVNDYLILNRDSARIYINDIVSEKGKLGGFAVSGRGATKGSSTDILQVTAGSTRIYVKDSLAGFGIANIEGGSAENFLNLNKQNYLIGHQTGKNTIGAYNSMIGYQAGYTNSSGSNNIFFGYKAGYLNSGGGNNVFIGTESGYSNQATWQSTYVGHKSGHDLSGSGNTAMGSMAGENAGGGNNTFIGTSAGRIATGGNNTFVGAGAGYGFPDENTGLRNTYIGQASGAKTTTGSYNVMLGFNAGYLNYEGSRNTFLGYQAGNDIHEGSGNVFIGHEAGKNLNGVSDRLFISNSDIATPLIYGEFDIRRIVINGNSTNNTNNRTFFVNGSAGGTGAWNSDSDIRLKKNVSTISDALGKVLKLRGVNFEWIDENAHEKGSQIGFIAQETINVIPEVVGGSESTSYTMQYAPITAVLVEAMKEQQSQIEALKAENEELKQKLNEIIELLNK